MSRGESSVAKQRVLLVVASAIETQAVLKGLGDAGPLPDEWGVRGVREGVDVLRTGVGKANAAGATARFLDPARHCAVVNVGIGGSFFGKPTIGWIVVASSSVFADEGVRTPGEFIDCTEMGFPPAGTGSAVPADHALVERLRPLGNAVGVVACVSTCSGTEDLARDVARRTGAIAEAMEGAAVGLAALRARVPFVEVRVISNLAGDRHLQQWDLQGALERLSRVIGGVVALCAEPCR